VYSLFTCIEEARIGLSLSLGIHGGHKGRSKNLHREDVIEKTMEVSPRKWRFKYK
jgi:hypothetical protein